MVVGCVAVWLIRHLLGIITDCGFTCHVTWFEWLFSQTIRDETRWTETQIFVVWYTVLVAQHLLYLYTQNYQQWTFILKYSNFFLISRDKLDSSILENIFIKIILFFSEFSLEKISENRSFSFIFKWFWNVYQIQKLISPFRKIS